MGLLARQVAIGVPANRASYGTQIQDQHHEGQKFLSRTIALVRQLHMRMARRRQFICAPEANV